MLEGMGKRMTEAAERIRNADSETLWAMIQTMAFAPWNPDDDPFTTTNNVIAAHILRIGEKERWTWQHTALVLAYVHIVMSNDHQKDLAEMTAYMMKPMQIHQHCASCTCKDDEADADSSALRVLHVQGQDHEVGKWLKTK